MKKLTYFVLILFTSIFLSACANSASSNAVDNTNDTDAIAALAVETMTVDKARPATLDEKYLFPELEQVKYIRSYKINGWSDIDKQSLFVSVSPNTSYLIILKRPSYDLPYSHGINFSSSTGTVYAKFDRIDIINIQNNINPPPAYIERIYKVEGKEQKKMIRAQIKGDVLKEQAPQSDSLIDEDQPPA